MHPHILGHTSRKIVRFVCAVRVKGTTTKGGKGSTRNFSFRYLFFAFSYYILFSISTEKKKSKSEIENKKETKTKKRHKKNKTTEENRSSLSQTQFPSGRNCKVHFDLLLPSEHPFYPRYLGIPWVLLGRPKGSRGLPRDSIGISRGISRE